MIDSKFHTQNRKKLEAAVYVLAGNYAMQSVHDQTSDFIQEANFLWLTGISEPGWKVIVDASRAKTILVAPSRSSISEIFDGGISYDQALGLSGADEVLEDKDFEPYLRALAKKHTVVCTVLDRTAYEFIVNPAQKELSGRLERIFSSVQISNDLFKKLRAIKQDDEIKAIKSAVSLTLDGFDRVRQSMGSFAHEYNIEAEFDYTFRNAGARHAYAPIVASGKNACTLHYGVNKSKIRSGQLVLMDIGARVDGYAADITRTYVKGSTSKRQREVHQATESAHHDIVKMLVPDLPTEEYIRRVDARMKQALKDLGLLKDENDLDTYRKYFPHAISHGLGIDVHDSLGGARYFEPGMVLTVEPGIYIPEEGIGVRIEDDILITKTGHQNLSAKLPTTLE